MVYRVRWTEEQQERFVRRWIRIRTEASLTQEEMARELGVHVNTVYRVEKGRYAPSNHTVLKFEAMVERLKKAAVERRALEWVPGSEGL